MASYYTSQAYDVPSSYIWGVLTDFPSWPAWFPQMGEMRVLDDATPALNVELLALDNGGGDWTRWKIAQWSEPSLLVCAYVSSNVPMSRGVQAAYLKFKLQDDPEGSTLDVELGAEGAGFVSDFLVGVTLGTGARRMLPQLVDAFSAHVVRCATST